MLYDNKSEPSYMTEKQSVRGIYRFFCTVGNKKQNKTKKQTPTYTSHAEKQEVKTQTTHKNDHILVLFSIFFGTYHSCPPPPNINIFLNNRRFKGPAHWLQYNLVGAAINSIDWSITAVIRTQIRRSHGVYKTLARVGQQSSTGTRHDWSIRSHTVKRSGRSQEWAWFARVAW